MSTSSWILRVLEAGFRLPWKSHRPPLLASPPPSIRPPRSAERLEVLNQEVQALVDKGAVEIVSPPVTPGFYCRLFTVPKSSGGWRPILDLSALNRFIQKVNYRMETFTSIRESFQPGDWAASIDLKDAYFHVLIHRRDRKCLRFQWAGQTLQFRALPFGLSLAPWIFTKVVREYLLSLRSQGIRIRAFLDDWLLQAASRSLCSQHVKIALDRAISLGFRPNYQKSELEPSQHFTFVGMRFDTVSMMVGPSLDRLNRFSSFLQRLLGQDFASARELDSLLGQMESMSSLLVLGRLHKRPLQRAFRVLFSQTTGKWDDPIPLHGWFVQATEKWRDLSWLHQQVPILRPQPSFTLFTDASGSEGWGGHLGNLPLEAEGVWSDQDHKTFSHINLKEMEGVKRCLLNFLPSLVGQAVRLFTDNMSVAAYINKQGGVRSPRLSLAAESLLLWCQDQGISLSARHVSGKMNVLADMLSRPDAVLQTEWTLCHQVLKRVWARFHRPHIDLFATRYSKRLPLYVSPVPDGEAWAVDALNISWSGMQAYAFPPQAILTKVILKARQDKACLILIAPLWKAQPWFPDLLQMSVGEPLPLNLRRGDLVQPRTGVPHQNVELLNLHAFLVCANHCQH